MPKCESTVIRNWLTAAEFAGLVSRTPSAVRHKSARWPSTQVRSGCVSLRRLTIHGANLHEKAFAECWPRS